MPARFVLKKGSTGKFRFNLLARNGQVIATSETYETKAKAMAGIDSVRKNAQDAVLVDGTALAAKPATKATGGAAKAASTSTTSTTSTKSTTSTTRSAAKPAAKPAAAKAAPAKRPAARTAAAKKG